MVVPEAVEEVEDDAGPVVRPLAAGEEADQIVVGDGREALGEPSDLLLERLGDASGGRVEVDHPHVTPLGERPEGPVPPVPGTRGGSGRPEKRTVREHLEGERDAAGPGVPLRAREPPVDVHGQRPKVRVRRIRPRGARRNARVRAVEQEESGDALLREHP